MTNIWKNFFFDMKKIFFKCQRLLIIVLYIYIKLIIKSIQYYPLPIEITSVNSELVEKKYN